LTIFSTLLKFRQIYLPLSKTLRIFPSGGRDAKEFPEGAHTKTVDLSEIKFPLNTGGEL
jgi:hypothetical protein